MVQCRSIINHIDIPSEEEIDTKENFLKKMKISEYNWKEIILAVGILGK